MANLERIQAPCLLMKISDCGPCPVMADSRDEILRSPDPTGKRIEISQRLCPDSAVIQMPERVKKAIM